MIKITFPDGAVREYPYGSTALDIAKSISEGLARKVLAASVNGQVWDATRPIQDDSSLKLLTWTDNDGKSTFWHSTAHLLAEAVESVYPGVKFWVGPPVDNGFYYDMDLGGRQVTEEDLAKLEKKMSELAAKKEVFLRKEIGKAEIGIVDQTPFETTRGAAQYRREALQRLNSYGWVDPQRGLIHVPIDKAIDQLLSQEQGKKP